MPENKKALTLSLIIPAYNEARHLKACLESVSRQSEPPDEVIVIDNNSTDNTVSIANSYPFVTVIHEKKQGVLWARNAGFNKARGNIIGRIDADTVLKPGWVRYVKAFYRNAGHQQQALTGGAYFYNIRLPHLMGWLLGQIAFRANRLLVGHYITYGSNMAFPRSAWLNVCAQTTNDPQIHEDLDLAIVLHKNNYKITYHQNFKVGVKMRRVRSSRRELWENLMWWPGTLRYHGKKTWVIGWIGAVLLYIVSPVGPFLEKAARIFGRSPIDE